MLGRSRYLSAAAAVCFALFGATAHAGYRAVWNGFPVVAGNPTWYSSAQEACQSQHDFNAPSNPGPVTARPYDGKWTTYECDWKTHVDGPYPLAPLPATTSLRCVDDNGNVAFMALVPPGICVSPYESSVARPVCSYNAGATPNPTAGDPVILSVGSLYEHVVDYQDEDDRFSISRYYRSRNGSGTQVVPSGLGDLWRFNFQWELALDTDIFGGNGAFAVVAPDGSKYQFRMDSSGNVVAQNNSVTDISVSFVGPSPFSYVAVMNSGGHFYIKTGGGNVVDMQLYVPEDMSRYQRAKPISITYRDGYQISFSYGAKSELLVISNSFGRQINVAWHYDVHTDDPSLTPYPRAISDFNLPDGSKLSYEYENYSGSLSSIDGQRFARLRRVLRTRDGSQFPVATYLYEAGGSPTYLTKIMDADGAAVSSWAYDGEGHVISAERANGVDAVSISYAFEYPIATRTVTNALGKKTIYKFRVTSPGGGEALLTDVIGEASSHCVGTARQFWYDGNGRRTQEIDERGYTTTYSYYGDGRLKKKIEAASTSDQRTVEYEWHPDFDLPTKIVKPGITQDFTYTAGRLTALKETDTTSNTIPYTTNGQQRLWMYGYNNVGLMTYVDGPLPGNADTTSFEYDASGFLAEVTNALGHVWQVLQRDGGGRPLSFVDPNGVHTELTYTAEGDAASVTWDANGSPRDIQYAYDARRMVTAVTQADGLSQHYDYDEARRLVAQGDDFGSLATMNRNLMGGEIQHSIFDSASQLNYQSGQEFDELARVIKVLGSGGQELNIGYDAGGNPTSITDSAGQTTSYQFNAQGQLKKEIAPLNAITEYNYDSAGYLSSVKDPKGNITSYTYDGFGDLLQVSSPDSGTTVFEYDAAGRRIRMTRSDGAITTYAFDLLGRQISAISGNEALSWTYDSCGNGIGRLCATTAGGSQVAYSYTPRGQLASQLTTLAGNIYSVSWAYDERDRVSRITYPTGNVVEYEYSGYDDINSIQLITGGTTVTVVHSIAHAPYGPVKGFAFGNGLNRTLNHDLDYRLTAISTPGLQQLQYGFNVNNQIIEKLDSLSPNFSQAYSYDAMGRLQNILSASGDYSWQFDENGSRENEMFSGGADDYIVDPLSNRLASVSGAGSRNFLYDQLGNLTSETGRQGDFLFNYDAFNRLGSVTSDGDVTSYQYDVNNLRTRKTGAIGTYEFIYGPEGFLLAEFKQVSSSQPTTTEYIWLGNEPIAFIRNGQLFYVHTDHLSRPEVITDSLQTPVWQAQNGAYGRSVAQSSIGDFNIGFPGQYYDDETGLFYNNARYYDSALGRYLESDPIGLEGGINTYLYANANPISFTDPYGLFGVADLPTLPQPFVDFSAGAGDTILFGFGDDIRDWAGIDGGVDKCSPAYGYGEWAGLGVSVTTGLAGGLRAAGTRGAGREFSHWIPNRMGGPRSIWNGNYVTSARHYYHDPFRYPRGWRDLGPKWPAPLQQFDRIPNAYKGAGAGAVYGAAGMAGAGCECQ